MYKDSIVSVFFTADEFFSFKNNNEKTPIVVIKKAIKNFYWTWIKMI